MDLKIVSIILWAKDLTKEIRRLDFKLDKINVITGDSQKGKSSIIPIIDYCLGSSKCSIPVGIIREKTEWFGIVIHVKNKLILIARKEPGIRVKSDETFYKENVVLENLPRPSAETNIEFVKTRLNEIVGLPYLNLNDEINEGSKNTRPSIRDFSAFQFQPQHIIANPYTLFYKADTNIHRERLKQIFPLVLGALDKETLYLRQQLKELEQQYKQKEREVKEFEQTTQRWLYNVKSSYIQAKEYGLIHEAPDNELGWSTNIYIKYLSKVPQFIKSRASNIQKGSTNEVVKKINELLNEELEVSRNLGSLRQKLYKMTRLFESEKLYENSLDIQKERLQPTNWLINLLEPKNICPFCGSESSKAYDEIVRLHNHQDKLQNKSKNLESSYTSLDKEIVRTRNKMQGLETSLNYIRQQKKQLEVSSEEVRNKRQTEQQIFQFVGRLEKELEDYKLIYENVDLRNELQELQTKINEFKTKIDPKKIELKLKIALSSVSAAIQRFAKQLGVEDAEQPIDLDIVNLTLLRKKGERTDYLWEIGSGANWMGYHIATLLALNEYFIRLEWNPVSQFLVLDQPSQVYFPEKIIENESEKDKSKNRISEYQQEDVIRVRKIFTALSSLLNGRVEEDKKLQIIVIEHADEVTWSGEEHNIHLVARWRGSNGALIPENW